MGFPLGEMRNTTRLNLRVGATGDPTAPVSVGMYSAVMGGWTGDQYLHPAGEKPMVSAPMGRGDSIRRGRPDRRPEIPTRGSYRVRGRLMQ